MYCRHMGGLTVNSENSLPAFALVVDMYCRHFIKSVSFWGTDTKATDEDK